ncbi:MAG: sigma-70 family RNA polymerase sigma factor [Puia sp.]|nr:sigma-70 family RNA polymerase sigma factor [Puia sp.]
MPFIRTISNDPAADEELVTRYKQSSDPKILGLLYQRYMDLVYSVCLKYLKEPETAKDSVLAIFEELVQKLQKHPVEHFRPWLYTLAKNHCLMLLRSGKNHKTREFDPERMQLTDNLHLDEIMEKEGQLEKLQDCIKTLAGEQKLAIDLFYLQNKCYKDIEASTGLDWNKVRSLIQNGRRNLKICMEKNANPEGESRPEATKIKSGA